MTTAKVLFLWCYNLKIVVKCRGGLTFGGGDKYLLVGGDSLLWGRFFKVGGGMSTFLACGEDSPHLSSRENPGISRGGVLSGIFRGKVRK